MRSVIHDVEAILNADIPVLLYQGLYDWIDGVYSNEAWMAEMQWKHHDEFKSVQRMPWNLDGKLVGFTRNFGPLYHVVIRDSGHLVAYDQPHVAKDMFYRFVMNL